MGYFATFSHVHEDRRTAVRLADDGRATLLITGHHGEIISSVDGHIDPLDAADIVADMMMLAPDLPNTGGEYSFGVGEGEAAPQLASFCRDRMPPAALNLEQRMREVAEQMRQAPAPAPPRVRRTVGMTPGAFAMWTGAFFAGHVGAGIVALIALRLLVEVAGFVGLLLSLPLVAFIIGAAYWFIGAKIGKRYGKHGDAWKPALAAVLLPSVMTALLGGGFVGIGLAWLYPLAARWGARGEV